MGSNSKVLECQVLFGVSLCFVCFSWHSKTAHYAPIKVHVAGILGRRGVVNQTLVKVMFQWKEPTMPVLIPPPPPRSDPIPWLVGLCGGRGQEARLVPILSPALGSPELLDYLPISTNCAGRH